MSYDPNNIFAKILRGEIPCKKISEDEFYLAFHDIQPRAPIHALVIPKSAYKDVYDFNQNAKNEEIIGFCKGINQVTQLLNLNQDGFRLISNSGVYGGQEVPHYHVHLLGGKKLGPMLFSS
ncbi:MAG: histidine triad nucleotide-binding protein [Alphaproteobacteria bacterium]|nr:histidine triad nucleotide-binding protein [Alphaproteobacteria bacterium]